MVYSYRRYGGIKRSAVSAAFPYPKRRQLLGPVYGPVLPPNMRARRRLRRRNVRTAGFLGIERKFYDSNVASGTAIVAAAAGAEVDPTPDLLCLNAIAQGDGESNRDGRKCIVKSLQIQGVLYKSTVNDQADAVADSIVRVLVVQDTQTNGAQLNSEDVLLDGANDINAMYNLQYSKRFRILMDRKYKITASNSHNDAAATGSVGYQQVPFRFYKSMNMPVNFSNTTSNIANITDNSLHVIMVANAAGCSTYYQARVRFVG